MQGDTVMQGNVVVHGAAWEAGVEADIQLPRG
jgi:hypothetical protein